MTIDHIIDRIIMSRSEKFQSTEALRREYTFKRNNGKDFCLIYICNDGDEVKSYRQWFNSMGEPVQK